MSYRFRICPIAAAVALMALSAGQARADELQDCERFAATYYKRIGSDVTRVEIERTAFPTVDRFEGKVGSQTVSSEVMGFARLTSPSGVRRQRFVCLHAGIGKGPVYFGTFPE